MGVVSINVPLEPEERRALLELSKRMKRHPRQQAALLLRRELERRGLLEPEPRPAYDRPQAEVRQ
jgi:hypothetical protein